ncbi:MAG: carboxypeptidase-like regulatory domain-containing protein [Salinivirgaceae bacterium]
MKTKLVISVLILLASFSFPLLAKNSPTRVFGKVQENTNGKTQAVAFAYVYIENSTFCTYTDSDGNFELEAPAGTHTVKIVFKGYKTSEHKVKVSNIKELQVTLKPEASAFAENISDN